MDNVKILQHNVAHWAPYRHILTNTYMTINPHIILINSHGLKTEENIKIQGYTSHKINSSNELHDGCAILVKDNIKHRIKDNYMTDILQITIETHTGPINIATTYLPPRRPYLPIPDFHQLASNNEPTYIIADFNAKHHILGDHYCNTVGNGLKLFIDNNKLQHLGPNFPTYYSHNAQTTPDIVFANKNTYHNHTIEAGPVTPSDHIPIILNITTQTIKIPITPQLNFNKANWDKFKKDIKDSTQYIEMKNRPVQHDIDQTLETWYSTILKATNENIPKTNTKTEQKPINTQQHNKKHTMVSKELKRGRYETGMVKG